MERISTAGVPPKKIRFPMQHVDRSRCSPLSHDSSGKKKSPKNEKETFHIKV